jgi:hypothetical protein
MIMKNIKPAGEGFIRFTDGLGRRRSKRTGLNPQTPPNNGPRSREKRFQHELMLERIRAEREHGIDPKYMHAHARRRFLADKGLTA